MSSQCIHAILPRLGPGGPGSRQQRGDVDHPEHRVTNTSSARKAFHPDSSWCPDRELTFAERWARSVGVGCNCTNDRFYTRRSRPLASTSRIWLDAGHSNVSPPSRSQLDRPRCFEAAVDQGLLSLWFVATEVSTVIDSQDPVATASGVKP